jgi:hypothetical protein
LKLALQHGVWSSGCGIKQRRTYYSFFLLLHQDVKPNRRSMYLFSE